MAEIVLNKEGFGLKLYNRFPPRYREDDVDTNYSLRRYLEATAEGGFNYAIDEWNGILNFADPDQATPQAMPILFKQFGLEVFNGIPETFLRYLLPRLGTAWSKKGGLDVIEFVASSISGVKTSTVVHPLLNGEVDIDIRLEMDFSLSDYLPDPKQFVRILSQFLPFYLDLRVIHVYRYHDRINVITEDTLHDHIIHTLDDSGSIIYDGCVEDPVMFPSNKVLNVDFILNYRKSVFPVPDVFFDRLTYRTNEIGSINSCWSPVNKYTRVEVDQYLDLTKYAPVLDVIDLSGTDIHKDHSRITNGETGVFSSDLSIFDRQTTTYHDKSILEDNMVVNDTVEIHSGDEFALSQGEDSRLDHVCIGLHPMFLYMLNTDFTLNTGFVTNYSNVDIGDVHPNEEVFNVVSSKVSETGVFSVGVSPVSGLLTNFTNRMLNASGCSVPDGYDVVQCQDGTRTTVFF